MRSSALLLLLACARTVPYSRQPLPCQAQAVELVWRDVYGRTDAPPDIWWVPPADQDCGRSVNGARGTKLGTTCAGAYTLGDNINLIWFGSWELTGLAHELAHVVLLRDGKDPDATHVTAVFAPGGPVETANRQLAKLTCR